MAGSALADLVGFLSGDRDAMKRAFGLRRGGVSGADPRAGDGGYVGVTGLLGMCCAPWRPWLTDGRTDHQCA